MLVREISYPKRQTGAAATPAAKRRHAGVSRRGKSSVERAAPLSVFFFPFRNCGCPVLAVFARAGDDAACTILFVMPRGLHRSYGAHRLHFITCSCYRRLPFLQTAYSRDLFLSILEQTRERYRFVVVGYVVMPEHVHLLITEPEVGTPSTVMQVLKQRTARALLPKKERVDTRERRLLGAPTPRTPFWQARFYDFNVWTTNKRVEKLRYMHRNPVKRGLASSPDEWRWSSYRSYLLDEAAPVRVNEGWREISFRSPAASSPGVAQAVRLPPFANCAKDGAPTVLVVPSNQGPDTIPPPPAASSPTTAAAHTAKSRHSSSTAPPAAYRCGPVR